MEVLDKPAASSRWSKRFARKSEPTGAFFWLSAFYLVYCARPEDWIPGLHFLPVAKITAAAALIGILLSLNRTRRKLQDLPRESYYLLALIGVLFLSAALSPVWKGGAINHTIDFSKVYIAWVLTFLLVSDFAKLKRIMFIQTASVAVICIVSVVKGHSQPRLEGVLGGIYSNPNDLAFAVVLSLPFCLAFLLTTKTVVRKLAWCVAMLCMLTALFLTASRGGFVTLVVSGAVALWYFGVKGKRLALIVVTGMIVVLLMAVAGRPLMKRLEAIGGDVDTDQQNRAYGSYEQRRILIQKAIAGIETYPFLGVGVRDFQVYSGYWRDVHVTYLQIAVEGGIPALILYLMFFYRGFANLRGLRKRKDLDPTIKIFVAALHSSLVGFVVGALFSPEAYQYFPYFAVAYSATLLALVKEQEASPSTNLIRAEGNKRRFVARPAFSPR
jgi:O-antigen ligase